MAEIKDKFNFSSNCHRNIQYLVVTSAVILSVSVYFAHKLLWLSKNEMDITIYFSFFITFITDFTLALKYKEVATGIHVITEEKNRVMFWIRLLFSVLGSIFLAYIILGKF